MADNPITVDLPQDLPENWNNSNYVSPGGIEVGLTAKHGYNYLMKQVNAAQQAAEELGEAFEDVATESYVGNKVKTNVPLNAVFTDTIYDDTAVKSDISSLQSDKADKTYVDGKVKTDVPADAKFTDTVYDDSTVKSDISTLQSGKADKTYVDNKVKTDVPENAKFTDTIVDISGKLSKSNDTLETYTEKTQATTGIINLSLANVFTDTPSASRTYSITNAKSGVAHSFTLIITMGETVETLTFPASVIWQGGEIPDMTTANKTYVLTFVTVDGGTVWLGMGGGGAHVSG